MGMYCSTQDVIIANTCVKELIKNADVLGCHVGHVTFAVLTGRVQNECLRESQPQLLLRWKVAVQQLLQERSMHRFVIG